MAKIIYLGLAPVHDPKYGISHSNIGKKLTKNKMEKKDRNKWTNSFRELGKKKGSRHEFIKLYKEMKKGKDKNKKID